MTRTLGEDPEDELVEDADGVEEGVENAVGTIGKYGLTTSSLVITLADDASRTVEVVSPFS